MRPPGRAALTLALVVAFALVGGCTPAPTARTPLRVGLGFIPSVQFAQFYLADQAGYYRDAGLDVTFENQSDENLITSLGLGTKDIGISDGTSLVPAVSQGIPVKYVATIYAAFPNVIYAKAGSGIQTAADLAGRTLGTPGRFGSGWIMLQAILASADLSPDDLQVQLFPDFGMLVALRQDAIDVATGFRNNEPVQLRLAGEEVNVLTVDEITPLPGNGLIAGVGTIAAKGPALKAFVAATLRAMAEIREDPARGLEAAIARIPELAADRDTQLAVLEATIEIWESAYTREHGLGAIDRDSWAETIAFMKTLPGNLVPNDVTVEQLVTEELLGD